MSLSKFPSEDALLGSFPDVGTIGMAPLSNGTYVVYEYLPPPIGWLKRAASSLRYSTEATLLADTAPRTIGTVATADDTGNAFVWNGTAWISMHGANWYTGAGAPDAAVGADNDLYLYADSSSGTPLGAGDVYQKQSGAWVWEGNIRGASGTSGGASGHPWYSSSGAPAVGTGADQDFGYDYTGLDAYQKAVTFGTLTPTQDWTDIYGAAASSPWTTSNIIGAPLTNTLYVVAVALDGTSGITSISLSGCGFTWQQAGPIVSADSGRLALFYGMESAGLSAGSLTVTWDGSAAMVAMSVCHFAGMDTTGSYGSAAVLQVATNATTSATSLAGTMSAFGDSTHNAGFTAVWVRTTNNKVPDTGWTELAELDAGMGLYTIGLETQWHLGEDLSPSVSWTSSVPAALVSIEIKASQSAPTWNKIGRFVPVPPSDATKFLNGAATPAFALVKDSDLSTSDITTNDVTTAKHGFVPKAPNDTAKFLRGDATWAALATPVVSAVYRQAFDVVSTAAETTIFTQSIAGGVLSTFGTILVFVEGDLVNNTGVARQMGMAVKFGGTTMWGDATGTPINASATHMGAWCSFVVQNENSASAQRMSGYVVYGQNSAGSTAGLGRLNGAANLTVASVVGGTSAVNTASAQTLVITATPSTSSASLEFKGVVTALVIP